MQRYPVYTCTYDICFIIKNHFGRYELTRSGAQGLVRQLVDEEVVELERFFMANGGVAPVRIDMRLKSKICFLQV